MLEFQLSVGMTQSTWPRAGDTAGEAAGRLLIAPRPTGPPDAEHARPFAPLCLGVSVATAGGRLPRGAVGTTA